MMKSLDEEFFNFAMSHNLDEIINFHNITQLGLKQILSENTDKKGIDSQIKNYDTYLSTNTFLMAYSHFEEYIYHLWKRYAKDIERA